MVNETSVEMASVEGANRYPNRAGAIVIPSKRQVSQVEDAMEIWG